MFYVRLSAKHTSTKRKGKVKWVSSKIYISWGGEGGCRTSWWWSWISFFSTLYMEPFINYVSKNLWLKSFQTRLLNPQDSGILDSMPFSYFAMRKVYNLLESLNSTYLYSRHLSRYFDCLAHPNLSATLATDQKWPLSYLRISCQSLAECH